MSDYQNMTDTEAMHHAKVVSCIDDAPALRYLSVCSGIEAATVAWQPLGWEAVAFAEVEHFPSSVLAHHYPDVPNVGDMTKINGDEYRGTVDIIVGGTPCQDFSVAGKRAGLAGERSGLAMHFTRLVGDILPRWILWENVPGAFSTNGGRDFGQFVSAMDELGYGLAWRTLDAQYFGVPQRRRRIFLVGHFGDWERPVKVLFEPESLCGDIKKSKKPQEEDTRIVGTLSANCGGLTRPAGNCNELDFCVPYTKQRIGEYKYCGLSSTLSARDYKDATDLVAHSHWDGGPHPCLNQSAKKSGGIGASNQEIFSQRGAGLVQTSEKVNTIRRITPIEAERLQGFPDDYTMIPYRGKPASECPDSPRYKAIGNSMAVPVMRWIGRRIAAHA